MFVPTIFPFVVVQVYRDVARGFVTLILLTPVVPQYIGISAAAAARGALKKSKGPTKSFSSAVNEVEALVLTIILLNGIRQGSDEFIYGSNPSLLRLTENSMN